MSDESNNETTIIDAGPEPLLEVTVGIDPDGHASASVPFAWKPTPELVEELRRRGFKQPYLLLTIRTQRPNLYSPEQQLEWQDDANYLVPLDRGLEYISFRRAGVNQVLSTIVDVQDPDVRNKLQGWVGQVDGRRYREDGTPDPERFGYPYTVPTIAAHAVQQIQVDAEMFAPEPPRWQRWLVSRFFEGDPHDQCHNRGRVAVSIGLAILSLTLGMALKLLLMACVLIAGIRELNWKGGLNPFEWQDGWPLQRYRSYTSVWFQKRNGAKRHWSFTYVFNPFVALLVLLISWCAENVYVGGGLSFGYALTSGLLYLFVSWAIFAIVIACGHWVNKRFIAPRRAAQPKVIIDRTAEYYALLEQQANQDGAPALEIGALPKGQRTLHLRFSELKAAVCRPFQTK